MTLLFRITAIFADIFSVFRYITPISFVHLSSYWELVNSEDITEAAALADRLASVLDALPAGVILVSDAGIIVEANPAARQIYGDNISGKSWISVSDRLLANPEDINHSSVARCDPANMGARRVNIDARPLPVEQGGGYVYLVHDVTTAALAEIGQAKLEKLAAVGMVAARCAHQIRTPLAAAMLDAGRIVAGKTVEKSASRLVSQLMAVESRVASILRYVRGESSQVMLTHPQAVLFNMMGEIKPLFDAKTVSLSYDFDYVEPINAPQDSLREVTRSLLDNALESGANAVRVRLYFDSVKSYRVLLVEDNGIGLKDLNLDAIYEPFVTSKPHGTGLGLSIASDSAKSFGGSLKAENRKEGGARFRLEF